MTIKQKVLKKEKTLAWKTTQPPLSQRFKCCSVSLPKKQINFCAKHLSSVLPWFFWMLNASRSHTTSEVLESFIMSLFCCVFWGRGLFCLISESKENRNLSQKNLHQICAFTYQTIFLKAETSCLGMLLIRLLTCLGLKKTFSPSKHAVPVFSTSSEPVQPNEEALKENFTEYQL